MRSDPGHTRRQSRGALGAVERLEVLLDAGSFVARRSVRARGAAAARAVRAGRGTIDGRAVHVFAHDPAVDGGALGTAPAAAMRAAVADARRRGTPLIGLHDTRGIRVEDGVRALHGCAAVLAELERAGGEVPRIAVVTGPCAGTAALLAGASDFLLLSRGRARLFLSGPVPARAAAQEAPDPRALGGAEAHARRSGLAAGVLDNEVEALLTVRRLLGFLPARRGRRAPRLRGRDPVARREPALARLFAAEPGGDCDIREVVRRVVDEDDLLELWPAHAPNLVTGLARLDGAPVAILANQPGVLAGCLDLGALRKAARFVRFCGDFGLPLVILIDAPGFVPGSAQEHGAILGAAADLAGAFASARVPTVRLVPRRAWGGPALAMGLGGGGATLAWPGAEIGLLGAAAAAALLPGGPSQAIEDGYRRRASSVRAARAAGLAVEQIPPARTRERICAALGGPARRRARGAARR